MTGASRSRPASTGDRGARFGPGAEFDLIASLIGTGGALPPGVVVGPGDDCAVLDGGIVLGCDMVVEGVHFRREWLSPREIGYRAAAAALSDLAAMAAQPVAALVSYALPRIDGTEIAPELQAGVETACRSVGAGVVGGDVTATPGPLTIDVMGIGRADAPVLRSGARAGDELWVTGRLGAAAAAVSALLSDREPPDSLRRAFTRPTPRSAEALWLVERAEITALIDISDGLAGDASHVGAASGTTLVLDAREIPVAEGVAELLGSEEGALRTALSGGDDYELLVVASDGELARLAASFRSTFGISLTRVGSVVDRDRGPVLLQSGDGPPAPPALGGWDHFGRDGAP